MNQVVRGQLPVARASSRMAARGSFSTGLPRRQPAARPARRLPGAAEVRPPAPPAGGRARRASPGTAALIAGQLRRLVVRQRCREQVRQFVQQVLGERAAARGTAGPAEAPARRGAGGPPAARQRAAIAVGVAAVLGRLAQLVADQVLRLDPGSRRRGVTGGRPPGAANAASWARRRCDVPGRRSPGSTAARAAAGACRSSRLASATSSPSRPAPRRAVQRAGERARPSWRSSRSRGRSSPNPAPCGGSRRRRPATCPGPRGVPRWRAAGTGGGRRATGCGSPGRPCRTGPPPPAAAQRRLEVRVPGGHFARPPRWPPGCRPWPGRGTSSTTESGVAPGAHAAATAAAKTPAASRPYEDWWAPATSRASA